MIETTEKFNINYIDASGMCDFNRCPAKYFFNRLLGLQLPDANVIALDYGTDMHFALPLAYDNPEAAIKAFAERWGKRSYGNDDVKRNVARAYASLKDFHNCRNCHVCPYKIEKFPDIKAPTADKISENEVPFLIDIGGPLALAGRIDAPVLWLDDDSWWALDYKTASEISPRYSIPVFIDGMQCTGSRYKRDYAKPGRWMLGLFRVDRDHQLCECLVGKYHR